MLNLGGIVDGVISLLSLIIFVSVIISWLRVLGVRVPHYNPIIRFLEDATEAMVRPLRRALPMAAGGLDFSPMVALILLAILRMIVHQML
jgi:YggT family protein